MHFSRYTRLSASDSVNLIRIQWQYAKTNVN